MRYSQALLDQIRDSVDIVDIIDSAVPLKKMGKNYFACCPFHDESTPSFSVNPEDQLYNCFGCGAGGGVYDFYEEFHNASFPEAVKALANIAGIELPKEERTKEQQAEFRNKAAIYSLLESANTIYKSQLSNTPDVVKYLQGRGLNKAVIDKFAIGAAKPEWRGVIDKLGGYKNVDLLQESGLAIYEKKTDNKNGKFYDRFRDAPVFPIRDSRGKTLSFAIRPLNPMSGGAKYINGPESPVFKKTDVVYGLYEMLQENHKPDRIMVVEGYMDVITSHQFGLTNTTGTMGTAITAPKIKALYRHTNDLIFCFDGDRAGYEASARALYAVLPFLDDSNHASFVHLPAGHDPDSLIREKGADTFNLYVERQKMPASDYILKLASKGYENLNTVEARGQLFANAKVMIDQMPPSAVKAILMSKLEDLTGIRPKEYLPYSLQFKEGVCNGVNLGELESQVKDFIAKKIGAQSGEVRVNWSMPEIGPRQAAVVPKLNTVEAQRDMGVRMREIGRILSLETQVSPGITLAQVLNTANTGTGDSKLMAKGLLNQYLSNTQSFDVECKLLLNHLENIGVQITSHLPRMSSEAKQQLQNWFANLSTRASVLSTINNHIDPISAHRIDSHVSAINHKSNSMLKEIQQLQKNPHDVENANSIPIRN